jgi:hypothetical protein
MELLELQLSLDLHITALIPLFPQSQVVSHYFFRLTK